MSKRPSSIFGCCFVFTLRVVSGCTHAIETELGIPPFISQICDYTPILLLYIAWIPAQSTPLPLALCCPADGIHFDDLSALIWLESQLGTTCTFPPPSTLNLHFVCMYICHLGFLVCTMQAVYTTHVCTLNMRVKVFVCQTLH